MLARHTWRLILIGHLARALVDSVCFDALRTSALWHNMTLRALGGPKGHQRPGLQRRLDNVISPIWSSRNEWCVHSAEDRGRWRSHDDLFVATTAPPMREGGDTGISKKSEIADHLSGSAGAFRQEARDPCLSLVLAGSLHTAAPSDTPSPEP